MSMSKMVQIRSVPDDVHRSLKVRAAHAGMTLSDFLLVEITHVANRPSIEDIVARIQKQPPPSIKIDSARLVRQMREGRL